MYDFAAESMLAQLAASAVEAKEEEAAAVINVLHRAVEYVCQTEAHAAFQGSSIMPQLEEHQERCWKQAFEEKRKGQGRHGSSVRARRSSARPPALVRVGQHNLQEGRPKHQHHQLIKPSTYAPLLPSPTFPATSPSGSESRSSCKLWIMDVHSLASAGSAECRGRGATPRARIASARLGSQPLDRAPVRPNDLHKDVMREGALAQSYLEPSRVEDPLSPSETSTPAAGGGVSKEGIEGHQAGFQQLSSCNNNNKLLQKPTRQQQPHHHQLQHQLAHIGTVTKPHTAPSRESSIEAPLLELNLGTGPQERRTESSVKMALGDALRLRNGKARGRLAGSRPMRGIAGLTGSVRRNDRPQIQDVRPQGSNQHNASGEDTSHAQAFEMRRGAKQRTTPPMHAPCASARAVPPNLDFSLRPAKPASRSSVSMEDHALVMVLNPLAPDASHLPDAAQSLEEPSADSCQHPLNQAEDVVELDLLRRHSASSLPTSIGSKDSPSPDSIGAPSIIEDELGVEGGAPAIPGGRESAGQDGASRRPASRPGRPKRDQRQRSFSVHQTIHEQGGYRECSNSGYSMLDDSWPAMRVSLAEMPRPHQLRSPVRVRQRAGGRRPIHLHHSYEHPSGSGMGFALPPSVADKTAPSAASCWPTMETGNGESSSSVGSKKFSFPSPNFFSVQGCGSVQNQRRLLDISWQQTETVNWERRHRKNLVGGDRDRAKQTQYCVPVVHILNMAGS